MDFVYMSSLSYKNCERTYTEFLENMQSKIKEIINHKLQDLDLHDDRVEIENLRQTLLQDINKLQKFIKRTSPDNF